MRLGLILPLAALGATLGFAAGPAPAGWERLSVPPMKTSIYVGRVTLTPGAFELHGDTYTASYEASVWPWFFWGEKGTVAIRVSAADLQRAAHGGTVDFAGRGANQKGRPRTVTGRVQPADATSGRLKIRIRVDGIELVFNGTYQLGGRPR